MLCGYFIKFLFQFYIIFPCHIIFLIWRSRHFIWMFHILIVFIASVCKTMTNLKKTATLALLSWLNVYNISIIVTYTIFLDKNLMWISTRFWDKSTWRIFLSCQQPVTSTSALLALTLVSRITYWSGMLITNILFW